MKQQEAITHLDVIENTMSFLLNSESNEVLIGIGVGTLESFLYTWAPLLSLSQMFLYLDACTNSVLVEHFV